MFSLRAVALLAMASAVSASFERIAGYEPRSSVTDHNALDLDQAVIVEQLALGTSQSFQRARDVYENGAHSKSVATLTLTSDLSTALAEDSVLNGVATNGDSVTGTLFKAAGASDGTIQFQYSTSSKQSNYVNCQVGGHPDPNLDGCLQATGTLTVDGSSEIIAYSYDPSTDNDNERTIQGFSTQAKAKMIDCSNGCPHSTYQKFYEYYQQYDYADKWVLAAFEGRSAGLANGNADFSIYGNVGKEQAIKKGTVFLHFWMYVIREMEDAIGDCNEGCDTLGCNDDPVHAWDEAVAFYTGSLEGQDGAGSGVLLYGLADTRCQNFKTCGSLADEASGTSHVNIEIFRQFNDGLRKLIAGECSAVRENLEAIEKQMIVPMIQGIWRYAYKVGVEGDNTEKSEAEGAAFAAAILPLIHDCDEDDAAEVYDNMRVGSSSTDFKAVRKAIERQYSCLGVKAADVGGIWDSANEKYLEGAGPAGVSTISTLLAAAAAGVAAVAMLF